MTSLERAHLLYSTTTHQHSVHKTFLCFQHSRSPYRSAQHLLEHLSYWCAARTAVRRCVFPNLVWRNTVNRCCRSAQKKFDTRISHFPLRLPPIHLTMPLSSFELYAKKERIHTHMQTVDQILVPMFIHGTMS